jgi:hypothetical protein
MGEGVGASCVNRTAFLLLPSEMHLIKTIRAAGAKEVGTGDVPLKKRTATRIKSLHICIFSAGRVKRLSRFFWKRLGDSKPHCFLACDHGRGGEEPVGQRPDIFLAQRQKHKGKPIVNKSYKIVLALHLTI